MGWARAGEIFDPVAAALIKAGVKGDDLRKQLGDLIGKLQDGDWDTEDESLEKFAGHPDVVAAFADRGVQLAEAPPWVLGRVGYEAYGRHSGGVSLVSGQELPGWDDLKPPIRKAWAAAGEAVAAVVRAESSD